MKLKKKVKRNILILLIIISLCIIIFGVLNFINNSKQNTKEVKIVNTIKEYGYNLKDNKSKKYQDMFKELKTILEKDEVDEEEYVKQISKMFIYDFYTLNDKSTKTDVGGVDFVYQSFQNNFLTNAESTYYKYVESNIYKQRTQKLPTVSKINIETIDKTSYEYEDKTDDDAYQVEVNWSYTSDEYSDYQKEATLIFVHEGKRLSLVELN